jgi:hypothetical protein
MPTKEKMMFIAIEQSFSLLKSKAVYVTQKTEFPDSCL